MSPYPRPLVESCRDTSKQAKSSRLCPQDLDGFISVEFASRILIFIMGLYTVFAWTAIVIAGGAYYWVYIRQGPVLGRGPQKTSARQSLAESSSSPAPKRKRKGGAAKQRTVQQTNDLFVGVGGVSADESEGDVLKTKSRQQVQDERPGRAEKNGLSSKSFVKMYTD
jgi:hypothetical protein